jgi:hypothetical protein
VQTVILPKQVALALECVIGDLGKDWANNLPNVSTVVKKNRNFKILTDYIKDNDDGFEMLQAATYVGYRVDALPEEKLSLYYHDANFSEQKGIKATLKILGIKIKGINNS